jgi:V/A-type H+/Na+-transporting ATPase subunit B
MNKSHPNITHYNAKNIDGSLVYCKSVQDVGFGETVQITTSKGEILKGEIVDISEDITIIQIFEKSSGIGPDTIGINFTGEVVNFPISLDILGRSFSGIGEITDDGPEILHEEIIPVQSLTINPTSRSPPKKFIQTGISVIDGLITLMLGQKLPILSGSGMEHKRIASQIVNQAKVPGSNDPFTIVFGAMGITSDEIELYREDFVKMGAMSRVVMFNNLAEDHAIEMLLTPRFALTAAEYLAFKHDHHVLVILIDMTNYCEALREISASRLEIPGRRGYPGYLYTDLATIYERAGIIQGKTGSITLIPILTMPDDDITHPIADLTNFITEGQIILDRNLFKQGIYPPIDPLACLSRMMDKGIGLNKTREDHKQLSDQIYYTYAEGKTIQETALISGEKGLTETDKAYIRFMEEFEQKFIHQGYYENRDIYTTLNLGWELLSILPESELIQITSKILKKYHPNYR